MRALPALLLLLTGCASWRWGTDLSTLRRGATRKQIESKLGSGKETKGIHGRTEVVYRFTPIDAHDLERAQERRAREHPQSGSDDPSAGSVLYALASPVVEPVVTAAAIVSAVPVVIGKTIAEVSRKRGTIKIVYHSDRVVNYSIQYPPSYVPPAPVYSTAHGPLPLEDDPNFDKNFDRWLRKAESRQR